MSMRWGDAQLTRALPRNALRWPASRRTWHVPTCRQWRPLPVVRRWMWRTPQPDVLDWPEVSSRNLAGRCFNGSQVRRSGVVCHGCGPGAYWAEMITRVFEVDPLSDRGAAVDPPAIVDPPLRSGAWRDRSKKMDKEPPVGSCGRDGLRITPPRTPCRPPSAARAGCGPWPRRGSVRRPGCSARRRREPGTAPTRPASWRSRHNPDRCVPRPGR